MSNDNLDQFNTRRNGYFSPDTDIEERFASALSALRAVDGLLMGRIPGSDLHLLNSDDLICLLRLIGHEFQEVYQTQQGGHHG